MNSNSAISLKEATKSFRGRAVLRHVSFEFARGDLCQIVGANGSGKSTLLRALAGVTPLNRGKITFADDLRRYPVGYVPQRGGHYPDLTLRENALLISSVLSREGFSLLDRMDLIGDFEFAAVLDRPLRIFSEGQRRLATFLAVWASRPRVLLADEPFAGVDPANAERLLTLLTGNDIGAALRIVTAHTPIIEGVGVLDLDEGG